MQCHQDGIELRLDSRPGELKEIPETGEYVIEARHFIRSLEYYDIFCMSREEIRTGVNYFAKWR